jgi:hypothetical protein
MWNLDEQLRKMTLHELDVLGILCAENGIAVTTGMLSDKLGLNTQQTGGILSSLKKATINNSSFIKKCGRSPEGWLWCLDLGCIGPGYLRNLLGRINKENSSYKFKK